MDQIIGKTVIIIDQEKHEISFDLPSGAQALAIISQCASNGSSIGY